ncbi:MAG: hypothetical protein M0P27_10560 [Bacteroidales bacterium]|nr:hypothetical protein [Bacteroidales bacterium]
MNYKEKIKELRKKMLLTQTKFAELLGFYLASVARWDLGENDPTMKAKRKLKELFIKNGIMED